MIRELLEKISLFETPEEDAKFRKRYEEEKAKEDDAKFRKRYEEEKAKEDDAKFRKRYEEEKAKEEEDAKRKNQTKNLAPVDANVQKLQKEIETAGGKFPKFGADGRWGNETAGVVFSDPKYIEIARKYADTIPVLKSILATKDAAKEIINRPAPAPVNGNGGGSAAQVDVSQSQSEAERKAEWAKWNDEKEANNAKSAAVATLKTLVKPKEQVGRLQYAIDPKDGIVYYGSANNSSTGGDPSPISFKDINTSTYTDIAKIIKNAGLTLKSVPKQYVFGTYQMAGVDVAELNKLMNPNSAAQKDNDIETNKYSLNYGNRKNTQGLKDPNLAFQDQMRANIIRNGGDPNAKSVSLAEPTQESVGFQPDELNRIVSLVHHR